MTAAGPFLKRDQKSERTPVARYHTVRNGGTPRI